MEGVRLDSQSPVSEMLELDDSDSPKCPACGKPMRRRTAGKGQHAGKTYWGCTGYLDCRETREILG